MEFQQFNIVDNHDPFSFMEMRRVPRSSMESTGSRRSIPSCPRPPSHQENYLMQDLFPNNYACPKEINIEVVQLKDESSYEKLFDDCEENDEPTEGSSVNPLSLSSRTGSSNN